jgi:hypothetical protein
MFVFAIGSEQVRNRSAKVKVISKLFPPPIKRTIETEKHAAHLQTQIVFPRYQLEYKICLSNGSPRTSQATR